MKNTHKLTQKMINDLRAMRLAEVVAYTQDQKARYVTAKYWQRRPSGVRVGPLRSRGLLEWGYVHISCDGGELGAGSVYRFTDEGVDEIRHLQRHGWNLARAYGKEEG